MKPKSIKSLLALALLAPGALFAQTTAKTTPVGYETLALSPGFNFVGVRLHSPTVASGTLESFSTAPNRVTDAQVDLGAILSGGTYILEITDGSGIIQEVSTATGTAANVAADLSSLTYPVSYKLRKSATLASTFGNAVAEMKVDIGAGTATGADQIWLFNGAGFTKYYFDEFGGLDEVAGWYNVDTGAAVNAANVNLVYADGFIVSSAAGRDVVVSGEVKTSATELNLNAGFNFVSSVAPTDTSLADAFGSSASAVTTAGLSIGAGTASGADQIWIYNGTGYTKVYFDEFGGVDEIAGWYNVDTGAAVASTTLLPSGYIISAASGGDVVSKVPTIYGSL